MDVSRRLLSEGKQERAGSKNGETEIWERDRVMEKSLLCPISFVAPMVGDELGKV